VGLPPGPGTIPPFTFFKAFLGRLVDCSKFNRLNYNFAAVAAYSTIEILQKEINEFPNQLVPIERNERQEVMENLENAQAAWEILYRQFFKYEDDLNALNIQYVKANKELF
jgi:hypothetical protein